MKKTNTDITRYTDGDFNIDIVVIKGTYEAWLSHKDIGIAVMMFGTESKEPLGALEAFDAYCDFKETVEANLKQEERMYLAEWLN